MAMIRKTGEGYYLVTLATNLDKLGRIECSQLKHDLTQLIKPHREISVNIKGIKSIQKEGYRILKDLHILADQKNCRIRYINADPAIHTEITSLKEKIVEVQDEFEKI